VPRSDRGMKLQSLHRVHRWIAIATGVFIVGWILTGVVALLPAPPPPPVLAETLDLAQIVVTPAEAARALSAAGANLSVRSIRLHRLGDVLAYEFSVQGRGPQLVDARSGRVITVDVSLARSIASARAPAGAQVVRTDLLSRRRQDLTYRWGALPAHRVAFDDPRATVVYVGAEDGSVRSTTRWSRAIGLVVGLHTLDPLDLVVREPAVRKAILTGIALSALMTALTGYVIAAWRQRGQPPVRAGASRN
jgi:hypothetical protein